MRTTTCIATVIACTLCCAVELVHASPFVQVVIAGRLHGTSDPYLDNVVGAPGQRIDYIVGANLINPGQSNSNGGTRNSTVSGVDGINELTLDLFESPSNAVQVDFDAPGTLLGNWGAGASASGGTLSPRSGVPGTDDLLAVHVQQSSGNFSAITAQSMLSGTFTVSTLGYQQPWQLMRWSNGGTGLIRINSGADTITINSVTESSSDPYVIFKPLAVGLIPEPANGCLLLFGSVLALLGRRR